MNALLHRTLGGALLAGAVLVAVPPFPGGLAWAQTDPTATAQETQTLAELRTSVEARYQVLPVQGGILLIPRYGTEQVQSIELSNGDIAVNGESVTGAELRALTGVDADAILRLSYIDPVQRRVLFGIGTPPAVAGIDTLPPGAADSLRAPGDTLPPTGVAIQSDGGDRVRLGGDVHVREGETVHGDVVAVGGSARIDGHVTGDVNVVGGTLTLGPNAVVEGDVSAAGGRVVTEPGAQVMGEVTETSFGPIRMDRHVEFNSPFGELGEFVATVIWIVFLGLLTALVYLLARKPVERMEYRVATSPWKAAAVGLAAQILFAPVLVLTVVILAISIVGIPLLLVVPFAILALMIGTLIGFTAVAKRVGSAAEERFGWDNSNTYVALFVGVGLIMAVTFFAAALDIGGGPLDVFAVLLMILGFILQYIAWTIGLGVLLLTRFGTRTSWADEGPEGAPAPAPDPALPAPPAPSGDRLEAAPPPPSF